jgi:hypothetical protein
MGIEPASANVVARLCEELYLSTCDVVIHRRGRSARLPAAKPSCDHAEPPSGAEM